MQKFCLTWKDYNNIFNKEFDSLRKTGDFFDVTLACEDHEISAHKLVLSASSEFFKALLRKHKHDHPLIYLKGVRFQDLQSILDFIYTGETEVSEGNLETLLATGGELRIKGLTEGQGDGESDGSTTNMVVKQYTTGSPPKPKAKKQRVMTNNSIRKVGGPTTGYVQMTGTNSQQMMEIKSEDGTINDQIDISRWAQSPGETDGRFLSNEPVAHTEVVAAGQATQPATTTTYKYTQGGQTQTQAQAQSQVALSNECELNRQVSELMVSSYDPVLGKTIWQCAQCHYSSKLRYTVKEHVETHISGFSHQCPMCTKTCKTRNALRVHTIRKHSAAKQPAQIQQQQAIAITTQHSTAVTLSAPVVPLSLPLPLTTTQLTLPQHPHPQAPQSQAHQVQVRQLVQVQAHTQQHHMTSPGHQASPHHQDQTL